MSDATDRIDRNARAALAVLGADTQRAFQRADESVEAFVSRMAYDIAYAMEAERGKRLESGQVVETVGMAFPVRVFGDQPGGGLWAAGVGSTERLQRITSPYRLNEIGFFVRDNNNVDWIPDGDNKYKRRYG